LRAGSGGGPAWRRWAGGASDHWGAGGRRGAV